jgi:hypothetical protein
MRAARRDRRGRNSQSVCSIDLPCSGRIEHVAEQGNDRLRVNDLRHCKTLTTSECGQQFPLGAPNGCASKVEQPYTDTSFEQVEIYRPGPIFREVWLDGYIKE